MTDARLLVARAPCAAAEPLRVGVLVSGSGSNLQALLNACALPDARFRVALVVSNVAAVKALDRAAAAGVPAVVESHKGRTREEFEQLVDAHLRAHDIEIVVLAGFMRILSPWLVGRWTGRIVNVHPALLPAFPGAHGARDALAAGVKVSGCTVHLVDTGTDTGAILAQAAVPVLDDDDEAALQARIQREEHGLLPAVVDGIARGILRAPRAR